MKLKEARKLINEMLTREVRKSIKPPAQKAVEKLIRLQDVEKLKKLANLLGYTGTPNVLTSDMIDFIKDNLKDADPMTIDFLVKKISQTNLDEYVGKFKEKQPVAYFDPREKKIFTGTIDRIVKTTGGIQYKLDVKGNPVWKSEQEIGSPDDVVRKFGSRAGVKRSPEDIRADLEKQFDRPEESVKIAKAVVKEEVKRFLMETGEMSQRDISPGGEDYEWAKAIEDAVKRIQKASNGGLEFIKMKPFDKYQGPYAIVWAKFKPEATPLQARVWSYESDYGPMLYVEMPDKNVSVLGNVTLLSKVFSGDDEARKQARELLARFSR